jgi:hypothetical protein
MVTQSLVLEKSTHPHIFEGNVLVSKEVDASTVYVRTTDNGKVVHGEHGTLAIESKNFVKGVQKEVNPITRALQNAFD